MNVLIIIFLIVFFLIFFAMVGYELTIKFIYIFYKNKNKGKQKYKKCDDITIMIVAHNEEKIIEEKLQNTISLNYDYSKVKIIVTSDNSTDQTNDIVKKFIKKNPSYDIKLFEVKERKGKINAQNEAQKIVDTEILIMTDANAMFDSQALLELVSSFSSEDIAYVCGQLKYINATTNLTADSENRYWEKELKLRFMESEIKTITTGNGAIYACRNSLYKDFHLMANHDSMMPVYFALMNKRAIYNPKALAYEKAGETDGDEFKRKVRMNRIILKKILPDIRILNIFKYGWFSYFYLGHRTLRNLLWLLHGLLLVVNFFIVLFGGHLIFKVFLALQLVFYLFAFIGKKIKFIIFRLPYYYTLTITAQWKAVINKITRKSKPFWEKAESTR